MQPEEGPIVVPGGQLAPTLVYGQEGAALGQVDKAVELELDA